MNFFDFNISNVDENHNAGRIGKHNIDFHVPFIQRRKRNIFPGRGEGGKVTFPYFPIFSRREMLFFLVEISILVVDPKQISVV